MPGPLDALSRIATLPDAALSAPVEWEGTPVSTHFLLFECLRREQSLATEVGLRRPEIDRILDLAQMAFGEIVGLMVGRGDRLLDDARDGEWSLRDLLRHAIAVEIRYAAQVEWGAVRTDDEPLAIPEERLACDRRSPPEPEFADSRSAGTARLVELLGVARRGTDERLATIPDAALERPTVWGERRLSVRMRAHQIAAHLAEVAIQAEKCLVDDGSDVEGRRIVRRLCVMRGAHERFSGRHARDAIDRAYALVAATRRER